MGEEMRSPRPHVKPTAPTESAGDVFIRLIKQRLSNPNRKNEIWHTPKPQT